MNHKIKIKKGLDIPLSGDAERIVVDMRSEERYAVKPPDVVGFTPRLLVAEGDEVVAGQPLVEDKRDQRLTLPSPVNGKVQAIVRGEKRRLMEVIVASGKSGVSGCSGVSGESGTTGGARALSPEAPVWWMIKERPFGTIADPDHKPKGIFVSMRDTNPLAPDLAFALRGREHEFEAGIAALGRLAEVHTVHAEGPHPAGNVGTQIAAISPLNKGEYVWTVNAQDVATIGRWCLTGEYRPEHVIAVGGPAAKCPKYYRVLCGTSIQRIAEVQLMNPDYPCLAGTSRNSRNSRNSSNSSSTRIISGSVLSGTRIEADGFLGMYDHQITFIEEGDQYEFMGWLMPGLDKFSFSKTFLSGLMAPFKMLEPLMPVKPTYSFNTNLHGSVRPFLFTGSFERVFPFDIYPLQLIKACIVGDIELQEQLGIYEMEPEDFALCEFIDPSKTEIQTIIREALEVLRKEATA